MSARRRSSHRRRYSHPLSLDRLTRPTATRLHAADLEWLHAEAKRAERSVSNVIRRIVRAYIAAQTNG